MGKIVFIYIFISLSWAKLPWAKPVLQRVYSQKVGPKHNLSTLIKTSLETEVSQPKNPISLVLVNLLNKKIKPTESMGNLIAFNHLDYLAISIKGEIYKNMHNDINHWIEKYDKKNNKALIFLINSSGGKTLPITKLQKTLDLQRLTTVVTGQALSAAANLFLLGKQKIMLPHTDIGFHSTTETLVSGSTVQGDPLESFLRTKDSIERYKDLPQKNRWRVFLKSQYIKQVFHSLKVTYYTAQELSKKKLIQKVSTPNIIIDKFWEKPKHTLKMCKKLFS